MAVATDSVPELTGFISLRADNPVDYIFLYLLLHVLVGSLSGVLFLSGRYSLPRFGAIMVCWASA